MTNSQQAIEIRKYEYAERTGFAEMQYVFALLDRRKRAAEIYRHSKDDSYRELIDQYNEEIKRILSL